MCDISCYGALLHSEHRSYVCGLTLDIKCNLSLHMNKAYCIKRHKYKKTNIQCQENVLHFVCIIEKILFTTYGNNHQ